MRKWISLPFLIVSLAALGSLACSRWEASGTPETALEGRYRSEEQWIAGEIVLDMLEMIQWRTSPASKSDDLKLVVEPLPAGAVSGVRVSFTLPPRGASTSEIVWRNHIWSAEDYTEVARSALLAAGHSASGGAPSTDERSLAALLTPLATAIEAENERASARLQRSMLDADAHEEAALVVGVLALREAAGEFSDLRQLYHVQRGRPRYRLMNLIRKRRILVGSHVWLSKPRFRPRFPRRLVSCWRNTSAGPE
jgi:hypothetical protein